MSRQTDESVVIIDEKSGTVGYGKFPDRALRNMTEKDIQRFNWEMSWVRVTSISEMRQRASRLLMCRGYDKVIWPLSPNDLKKLERHQPVPGLLLCQVDPRNFIQEPEEGDSE